MEPTCHRCAHGVTRIPRAWRGTSAGHRLTFPSCNSLVGLPMRMRQTLQHPASRWGERKKGKRESEVAQSYPTLCDPMDCSLPGSSVHGISQAKYWSGLPFPSPGDLPNPGIELMSLMSPVLASEFFTTSAIWWRRKWQPTPVFSPGESQGWAAVYGVAQSRTHLKRLSSSSSSTQEL